MKINGANVGRGGDCQPHTYVLGSLTWVGVIVLSAAACGTSAGEARVAGNFEAKGVQIHYVTMGSGPAVVLVHGLMSSGWMNWELPGIASELAKDHKVILLDLPGHGESAKPENEDAYGVQMVEDVVLLMDHLKIKTAHVAGYSLGGMIVLKLLTLHPERVTSATLGGMGWLKEGSLLQGFWSSLPAREGGMVPAALTRSIGKLAVTEADVRKVSVPVKVLVGDRDPVKRLYVEPLTVVRPDWAVETIPGAGHLDCLAHKEFKDGLSEWIRKNRK